MTNSPSDQNGSVAATVLRAMRRREGAQQPSTIAAEAGLSISVTRRTLKALWPRYVSIGRSGAYDLTKAGLAASDETQVDRKDTDG